MNHKEICRHNIAISHACSTCRPPHIILQGPLCNIDLDKCRSNPCLNGATCTNKPNDYTCKCAPDYYGFNCDSHACDGVLNTCMNGATCIAHVSSTHKIIGRLQLMKVTIMYVPPCLFRAQLIILFKCSVSVHLVSWGRTVIWKLIVQLSTALGEGTV